jgi:predicted nucleic acid-binding protein
MIHGLDTGFLVAAGVVDHAEHTAARETLARLLAAGDIIRIAPQVLQKGCSVFNCESQQIWGILAGADGLG